MVLNQVRIRGRVLRDADAFARGRTASALFFCVSVPTKEKGQEVYVDCVAFPDVYEQFDGFLEKGDVVTVDGSLIYRTWTDSFGTKRSGMEVMVEEIEIEE